MIKIYIKWINATWKPKFGCRKVSAGYKYCYMHRMMHFDNPSNVRRNELHLFNAPLKLKRPLMVFTCSMSDFFIEDADQWRPDEWKIIRATPHLTYQILTEKLERIAQCLPVDWGRIGYPNAWLGTSIENQSVIDRMIILPQLKTRDSNFKLFISAESLIRPIDFVPNQKLEDTYKLIDWIVAFGELGYKLEGTRLGLKYYYRIKKSIWFDQIISQCKQYQIPFFMKQLGNNAANLLQLSDKKVEDISEWHLKFQIREWPLNY